jgi:chromosome segregation ATPase
MSVLTTLALMVTSLVAKPQPPDVEITRLQAKIDELERQLEDIRRDVDGWMDIAQRWRARYEALRPNNEEIVRAQMQAQQLMAMAQSQSMQQTIAAQNSLYCQQMPGLAGAYEGFCNCVPARHDMFRLEN